MPISVHTTMLVCISTCHLLWMITCSKWTSWSLIVQYYTFELMWSTLRYLLHLVLLTIRSYTMLYSLTIYHLKMLRFYNVQTSNLIFVGKTRDFGDVGSSSRPCAHTQHIKIQFVYIYSHFQWASPKLKMNLSLLDLCSLQANDLLEL